MKEREGAVTLDGAPLTVIGDRLEVGDRAPDFHLVANDLSEKTLADYTGKPLLVSVVPSLFTGICDAQTRRFDEEAVALQGRANFVTVSIDHPFAQKGWCGNAGAETIDVLSDHRDMSFGDAWGTHVKELRLEQRAVFVVDADGIIRHAQYVPEIGRHPDYDGALAALTSLTG